MAYRFLERKQATMGLLIEPASKFVMIGDSITDSQRARPIGEGLFGALGQGYVSLVNGLLQANHPQAAIRVVNMGTSGNTVRDLASRWQTDVLDLQPDWLSIMIGINDVWRQFDSPWQAELHVPIVEYEQLLQSLVVQTRPLLKGLILMTPYFIEPNRSDPMRIQMDAYGQVVQAIATKHNAIIVNTQAAFDSVLEHVHPMTIAWDRVHPTLTGHIILAQALLQSIGYSSGNQD
jgi:lysophospholipase L1-like esterase